MTNIILASEKKTKALAKAFAENRKPGDILLLEGPLGAGKSTFARTYIRTALANSKAEVPSPTYTLVQTYEAATGEVFMHADLYRLSDPEELEELGLIDAMEEDAVLLVEWPDKVGVLWPSRALRIRLDYDDKGGRTANLQTSDKSWHTRLKEMDL